MAHYGVQRPASRRNFEIVLICALPLEADAVEAVFDHHWDDDGGPPFDKFSGDPNTYSTGTIGRHNVVLAHMPGMGKANAAFVAANCRASFPNIRLAIIVGICGCAPQTPDGEEIVLGDVIISDGVIQHDLGRQMPERFVRKNTLLDSLGRPDFGIRGLLSKLRNLRGRQRLQDRMTDYLAVMQQEPGLAAHYPGVKHDILFEPTYRHTGDGELCDECGCDGPLVPRNRLSQDSPQPAVHFGLIASGDIVLKSGEGRDAISRSEGAIGFEMESAGVWDSLPCVVIKGACDYADSHKVKLWQRYAAATAAACMKAVLESWIPSSSSQSGTSYTITHIPRDSRCNTESIRYPNHCGTGKQGQAGNRCSM
jgi:nucleoside phosphorylase